MTNEWFDKIMAIISTHDEGDGEYCDTGEDMDWYCRSRCIESAKERLQKAFDDGEI
ncbi:MAG: hypothetical protein OEZ01_07475 [Candidatus Heimdallarchaeota archaeon]|nr:hypothetical protein [Candidatus Heimdallarchaeota archaeon]